jgi:hypothetical protein
MVGIGNGRRGYGSMGLVAWDDWAVLPPLCIGPTMGGDEQACKGLKRFPVGGTLVVEIRKFRKIV